MKWERFTNWLEARPWTLNFPVAFRAARRYEGKSIKDSVVAAVMFPHVHCFHHIQLSEEDLVKLNNGIDVSIDIRDDPVRGGCVDISPPNRDSD